MVDFGSDPLRLTVAMHNAITTKYPTLQNLGQWNDEITSKND